MIELVKKQEVIIEEMRRHFLNNKKLTPLLLSALSTLDNMNQMQEYYVETMNDNHETSERILRLFALFQGLFVSIDALYSLAYYLSKSKTFINLNQNKVLKEIRYIRNDVVGHPVNRVYENNQTAYCVLEKKNILDDKIFYDVYMNETKKTKEVSLSLCLKNYYSESNELLTYLLEFNKTNKFDSNLLVKTKELYENVFNVNYDLTEIKELYISIYNQNTVKQSRYLWRLDLIQDYREYTFDNNLQQELFNYAVKYQVKKMLEIAYDLSGKKLDVSINAKFPKYLFALKQFVKKHNEFLDILNILKDNDHNYFEYTLNSMIDIAEKNNNLKITELLKWLKNINDERLVYIIAASFKTIKI